MVHKISDVRNSSVTVLQVLQTDITFLPTLHYQLDHIVDLKNTLIAALGQLH
jgi:hypothetical protein